MTIATMQLSFRLIFRGPPQHVRARLGELLRQYPEALFIEREALEYRVVAPEATEARMRTLADWRIEPLHELA